MRHGRTFKKLTESDVRVRLGSFNSNQVGALHDPREEWEVGKKQLPGANSSGMFCGSMPQPLS